MKRRLAIVEEPTIAYIYVMGTDGAPIKIGYSTNPDERRKAVRNERRPTEGPVDVAREWEIGANVALAAERYVHWQLREHHVIGEWFDVPLSRAAAVIDAALKLTFDPDNPCPPVYRKFPQQKLDTELLARINAYRRSQPDLPNVSEAIRRLVEAGLERGKK